MNKSTQQSGKPAKKQLIINAGLISVAIALLIGGYFWIQYRSSETPAGQLTSYVLAAETSLLPTTVWVAENQRFFREEGLDLEIRDFDSGRNALEAMLTDESINMATVAQTPVVFNSFNGPIFVIVATMAYSIDDVKILARTDQGIQRASDLQGKRVGATLRSTGHYFLDSFLAHYGLSLEDVDLRDIDAAQLSIDLQAGRLDAITTWEPHIYNAQKVFAEEDIVLLVSPTPFRKDFFFTVRTENAARDAENIRKFLRAVVRAEEYIRTRPTADIQKIVQQRISADQEVIEAIWDEFTFRITLEQSILVNIENEANWAIRNDYFDGPAPNYLKFIYFDALESVKPDAVTVIH